MVAVSARRLDRVESLAGELAAAGHSAMAIRLDVADAHAIGPALDEVEAGLGPVSILVNNAGVGGGGAGRWRSPSRTGTTPSRSMCAGTFVAAREARQANAGLWRRRAG